jgi:hypothetical protein
MHTKELNIKTLGWLGFWFFFGKGMLWLIGGWLTYMTIS